MKYINVIPLVLALVFSFFNSASAFDFAPTTAWLGTNFFHASNSVTAISAIGAVSNSVASSGNTNLLGTDQNGNQVSIKITSINGGGSGQSYGAGAGISTNTFSISVTGWLLNILGTGAITNASELSGNFDTFGAGLAAAQAATNGLPWWGNTYQTAAQVASTVAGYVPITQTNAFIPNTQSNAFALAAEPIALTKVPASQTNAFQTVLVSFQSITTTTNCWATFNTSEYWFKCPPATLFLTNTAAAGQMISAFCLTNAVTSLLITNANGGDCLAKGSTSQTLTNGQHITLTCDGSGNWY